MNEYIFRFPADTPPMTFDDLALRLEETCDQERCTSCYARIGTTVQVRWHTAGRSALLVRLYETTIAILEADGAIRFPNDDPHMATAEWISRIVRDNGLGSGVGRIRRRRADGPGPEGTRGMAGLLVIDGDRDKPVHGRAWTQDRERMARDQDFAEKWAAEMTFRSLHPDQWKADLAAAQPHQGMPDYRNRVDARHWQGSRRRPSLSDIR